jgi:hypothetical protein
MAFLVQHDHGYESETHIGRYIEETMVNAFIGFDARYRKLEGMR